MVSRSFHNDRVTIHDEGLAFTVVNHANGKQGRGVNHDGPSDRQLFFACTYTGKQDDCEVVLPRSKALDYVLKQIGLPKYSSIVETEKYRLNNITDEIFKISLTGKRSISFRVWTDEDGNSIFVSAQTNSAAHCICLYVTTTGNTTDEQLVSTKDISAESLYMALQSIIAGELKLAHYC